MEPINTTFNMDFTIADRFGLEAIKDTYDRAFKEWKNNHEYLTALVIALNHKIWEHYEKHNDEYARLYDELWRKTDTYAMEHLRDEQLQYYLNITD